MNRATRDFKRTYQTYQILFLLKKDVMIKKVESLLLNLHQEAIEILKKLILLLNN